MSKPNNESKTPRRVTGLGSGSEDATQPPHGDLSKDGPSRGGKAASGDAKRRQMKGIQPGRASAGRANCTHKKILRKRDGRIRTGTYLDFQKGIKEFWERRGVTARSFNGYGA